MTLRTPMMIFLLVTAASPDSETEWQRMLSELRETGCPVSLEEIDAQFDGTPLLTEAERWLKSPPVEAEEALSLLVQLNQSESREALLAQRNYVEVFAVPYGLVEQMLQKPRCDFGARRYPSFPPYLAHISLVHDVLAYRVLMTAANGDVAQAAAYLGDMAEIGRRAHGLGRGVMALRVAELCRQVGAVSSESRDLLRSVLEPVLERAPRMGSATVTIDTDIARTVDAVARWSRGEKVSDAASAMCFAQQSGWSPSAAVNVESVGKVKKDVVKYVEEAKTLRNLVEADPAKVLALRQRVPLTELVRVHVVLAVESETEVNLARVGLALALYRERHGEWPESLEALAGLFPGRIVPRDTAGGGEFAYSPTGDYAEVSSRGGKWYRVAPSWVISKPGR